MQKKALDQWTRELPVMAKRGKILDRNDVVLVDNQEKYSIFIRKRSIEDIDFVARRLAEITNDDFNEIKNKIVNTKSSEIAIKKQVDKEIINKLSENEIKGVYFTTDNVRIYPYNEMLCQVLGYTTIDGTGLSGIEAYYNKYLSGYNGEILYEADLIGKDIENTVPYYVPATNGLDVKLTIDYEIQQICERVMEEAIKTYNPKSAKTIVVNPQNGEILALCNLPSYNLNEVPRDNLTVLNSLSRNGLIVDSYEPGSTFKILTAGANIEEFLQGNSKAFSLNYVFNGASYRMVGGKKIKCWTQHKNGKHANETLQEALNNSCNPCFVDIALSLGKSTMYKYISAFNYGKTTGVDFNGEALGMVLPETVVTDGDIARISFGQTIAVTPLQLAMATCSAINGGKYYEPHFVKEIGSKGKIVEIVNPKLKNTTISEKASQILAKYLENVVAQGSGKQAYIEGYKVGGKTGTAQKFENGFIAQGKYVMSFIGFFPANNPKYLALTIVDEPIGGQYGSTVSAPLTRKIFEGIISAKNIEKFE